MSAKSIYYLLRLPFAMNVLAATVASGLELRISEAAIEVWSAQEKLVLRYHKKESAVPDGVPDVYRRSGYIHPLMTPDGREVSGDFSPDHLHQHGVFMAWTSGRYKGKKIDFWNQKKVEGRVAHRRVLFRSEKDGLVSFTVELSHFDQREAGKEILREIWTVVVRSGKADQYYVIDIESRQSLVGEEPLKLEEYHYGGMALRANRAWLGKDACQFLTSEGRTRGDGNHTRPNWVEVSGEIEGKPAAVVVMGHPENFRAPQPVRIHPEMPYFCFSPMVVGEFSIGPGKEYLSRYRFLVSGTELEKEWIESRWKAYAE